MGVCLGLGAVQVGEVWQGLTLQVENPRKGKLDIWGIHSSAVFLQLVGKDGVSMARKAEPVLGTVMGAGFQAQMVQLKFSLSPFQHLFAKLPLKLLGRLFWKCCSCHRISAQEIKVIIDSKTHEQREGRVAFHVN